jgi:hypothetical protein
VRLFNSCSKIEELLVTESAYGFEIFGGFGEGYLCSPGDLIRGERFDFG